MGTDGQRAAEFGAREVAAARIVIADLWSSLPSFRDALVLVGGWVPDLLLPSANPRHTGSLDVDVLLDPSALGEVRLRQLLEELRAREYRGTAKRFRLEKSVDLGDGGPTVTVQVDLLAPAGLAPELEETALGRFRAFEVDGAPPVLRARETVAWPRPSGADAGQAVAVVIPAAAAFLVMKAFALRTRVKPKDVYDVVFILRNWPGGASALAAQLGNAPLEADVKEAMRILAVWFGSPEHLGPQAYAGFLEAADRDSRALLARDAFERVQALLRAVGCSDRGR